MCHMSYAIYLFLPSMRCFTYCETKTIRTSEAFFRGESRGRPHKVCGLNMFGTTNGVFKFAAYMICSCWSWWCCGLSCWWSCGRYLHYWRTTTLNHLACVPIILFMGMWQVVSPTCTSPICRHVRGGIYWLIYWFIAWLIDLLIDWQIDRFVSRMNAIHTLLTFHITTSARAQVLSQKMWKFPLQ